MNIPSPHSLHFYHAFVLLLRLAGKPEAVLGQVNERTAHLHNDAAKKPLLREVTREEKVPEEHCEDNPKALGDHGKADVRRPHSHEIDVVGQRGQQSGGEKRAKELPVRSLAGFALGGEDRQELVHPEPGRDTKRQEGEDE